MKFLAIGGPFDGSRLEDRPGAFLIAHDGSVYRYEQVDREGRWMYCGPRAGRCRDCGAVVLPAGKRRERSCRFCGGKLAFPGLG
jgi:hypothetical protein